VNYRNPPRDRAFASNRSIADIILARSASVKFGRTNDTGPVVPSPYWIFTSLNNFRVRSLSSGAWSYRVGLAKCSTSEKCAVLFESGLCDRDPAIVKTLKAMRSPRLRHRLRAQVPKLYQPPSFRPVGGGQNTPNQPGTTAILG
jgi:hypothetical protein